ncbi:YciI family protein [Sphingomonas sp.]|uniref:YciI family protein n=1 Tax=Sphingomonas sp. TaxID=28214 RepID=UPI0025F510FD|nr:YciI family protein [Sphingomonas sp.]
MRSVGARASSRWAWGRALRIRLCRMACIAGLVFSAPALAQDDAPPGMKRYFMVFLIGAPGRGPMPDALFEQHMAYIRRMVGEHVYKLAGPLTDRDRIAGIIILSAPSIEAARGIVAADPSVRAGVFSVEVHPALLPSLEGLTL